ncbi:hypothetical protein [Brevundimonas sp.]
MIGSPKQLAEAIATVASGGARRISAPGHWVVWRVEGQAKPRLRVFA